MISSESDKGPVKHRPKTVSIAQTVYVGRALDPQVLASAEAMAGTEWQVGDTILGIYKMTAILGEGGMGRVYKVRHLGWDMDLAVKIPKKEILAKAGAVEDFTREAETWINMGLHPNVVNSYYVRTLGRIPMLFLEYVTGGSLSDWIANGKLYQGDSREVMVRVLDVAIQSAWGIYFAHQQGLVHQDVKPANIMMADDGVVKITDFGIARARGHAAVLGPAGAGFETMAVADGVAFTPQFASPEQIQRQSVTRRSDIWSWAATVAAMFARGPQWAIGPLAGEWFKTYLTESRHDNSIVRPPSAVVDILLRCFASDPENRPSDINEVAQVLVDTHREMTGRAFRRIASDRGLATADSLNNRALSLLDLGKLPEAMAMWNEALELQPHHPESTYNHGLTQWRSGSLTDAGFVKGMTESLAAAGNRLDAQRLLGLVHAERGDFKRAHQVLEPLEGAEESSSDSENLFAFIEKNRFKSRGHLHRFGDPFGRPVLACTDPECRYIVAAGKTIEAREPDNSPEQEDNLMVLDAWTGKNMRSFRMPWTDISCIAISPDRRTIAVAGRGDGPPLIALLESATGQTIKTLEEPGSNMGTVRALAFSKDCGTLLSGGEDGTLRQWNTRDGKCMALIQAHDGRISSVALAPAGRHALTGGVDKEVKVWDLRNPGARETLTAHSREVVSVSFSTNTRHAVSGGLDGVINICRLAGDKPARTLAVDSGGATSVTMGPDSRYVLGAYQDSSIRLWELTTGRCLWSAECRSPIVSLFLAADGDYAFSVSANGDMDVWCVNCRGKGFSAPFAVSRFSSSESTLTDKRVFDTCLEQAETALQEERIHQAAKLIENARTLPGYDKHPRAMALWRDLCMLLTRNWLVGGWQKASFEAHTRGIGLVAADREGRHAAVLGADNTLNYWDLDAQRLVLSITSRRLHRRIDAIAVSNDGRCILLDDGDEFLVYQAGGGELITALRYEVRGIAAKSKQDFFRLVFSGNRAILLKRGADRVLCEFERNSSRSAGSFSTGLVSMEITGNTVNILDLLTGRTLRRLQGHEDAILCLATRFDGKVAITGGRDKTLKLWDVDSGGLLGTLEGHTAAVTCACITLDGKYAFSGSADKSINMWYLRTGKCLRTFQGHAETVTSLSLSRDGLTLVSGSSDKSVRVWTLEWELDDNPVPDWNPAAAPHVKAFVEAYSRTPAMDNWTHKNLTDLIQVLQAAGYGRLSTRVIDEQVRLATGRKRRGWDPGYSFEDEDAKIGRWAWKSLAILFIAAALLFAAPRLWEAFVGLDYMSLRRMPHWQLQRQQMGLRPQEFQRRQDEPLLLEAERLEREEHELHRVALRRPQDEEAQLRYKEAKRRHEEARRKYRESRGKLQESARDRELQDAVERQQEQKRLRTKERQLQEAKEAEERRYNEAEAQRRQDEQRQLKRTDASNLMRNLLAADARIEDIRHMLLRRARKAGHKAHHLDGQLTITLALLRSVHGSLSAIVRDNGGGYYYKWAGIVYDSHETFSTCDVTIKDSPESIRVEWTIDGRAYQSADVLRTIEGTLSRIERSR